MSTRQTSSARFLIGIDLGTTHTVVAYADLTQPLSSEQINIFEIEQLVAPGEVAKKPLLPSFRYHPTAGELAAEDLVLPWQTKPLQGELPQVIIGQWARELGSKVAGRLVSSAKSWLSHPQVDRSAAILPWGAAQEIPQISPVIASASYLSHICHAWDHAHPEHHLAAQQVVITVPASFDEAARSLTVEAAALAGLTDIVLLEEPQAVCYDWYNRHHTQAKQLLQDIPLLMVCDVGGGTTDLSLISVGSEKGELTLNRIGVGDHLMLGGDNVDLALAHSAEQQLNQGNKKLNSAALSQLIQQTRIAKEALLADNAKESATVTVLGSGSRLIGGAKSCELTKSQVHQVALDGFFPLTDFAQQPQQSRSAMVEFGLPYAADPAISKHLSQFLSAHQSSCRQALGMAEDDQAHAIPSAVLFNGGVFNSPLIKQRACDLFEHWRGQPVTELENKHPDLAVAYGAVAYSMARRGTHLTIGGGSARSFFLLLDEAAVADNTQPQRAICLLSKGTEHETEICLTKQQFVLRLGQPVSFRLVSTTAEEEFLPGTLIDANQSQFVTLPPLIAQLSAEESDNARLDNKADVTVNLAVRLTEVGTLKLECVRLMLPQQRWQVEFQLRQQLTQLDQDDEQDTVEPISLPPKFAQATVQLQHVYGQKLKQSDPKAVKQLRPELEKLLGKRDLWPTPVLRALADQLLGDLKNRRRSDLHERNWFKLAGFTLRPGFGYPVDPQRIEQCWPLYQTGLQFNTTNLAWSDWWIFWRRIAGGLTAQQQQSIYGDIAKYINPSVLKNRKLSSELNNRAYEEMVRLAASMEHLSIDLKVELVNWLLVRLKKTATQSSWWAIGRIASRSPFYGSSHNMIGPEQVEAWLPQLLACDWKKQPHIGFSAVMMTRKCGDRSRDIDEQARQLIITKLKSSRAPDSWLNMVSEVTELTEVETKRIFGDALPSGLKLLPADTAS
jgi:molecular chaperone DnaK (HSP70)